MKLKRYVEQGEIVPRGYGYCFTEHWCKRNVFYPFPLNWIIRYARILWHTVRHPRQAYSDDNAVNEARLEILERMARFTNQLDDVSSHILNDQYREGSKRAIRSVKDLVCRLKKDYEQPKY